MPFYPLFNIYENLGFVQLSNFPPNNWEKILHGDKNLFAYKTDGNQWEVNNLGIIYKNQFKGFQSSEFSPLGHQDINGVRIEELVLMDLRQDKIPDIIDRLPKISSLSTSWPEWRATIGFKNENSRVSYQGEILPFPSKASLLTFHPFIQFDNVSNYFVFLNLESSPIHRWAEVEIFLANSGKKIDSKKIRNNAANIFPLDDYGFTPEDLPIFYCKSMAGIPFGFGKSKTSEMLSLEHTHPPGSLTLHGNRMHAQRDIKLGWVNHFKIHIP
jgi:hypothetical protein